MMSPTIKLGLGANNKFIEYYGVKIGPLWANGIFVVLGLTCLLSSMGGHFVDDDMTNAPLFGHMFQFETVGLRVASVAIPIPLFWDLLADIYHLISRNTNPAFQVAEGSVLVDAEWYRKMRSICAKEWWIRCTFLLAMLIPSSVLLFSDPEATLGLNIIPYLSMFFRCICLFGMTNGYLSDLYDDSIHLKIRSLLTTGIFILGILMTFFGRVSVSQFRNSGVAVGLCGIVLSSLSISVFAMRVIYHTVKIAWREFSSIEATITMEEYIFICYTLGTTFIVMSCFFSFYSTRGLRYDTIEMPVLITYHVLMIVGTMSSVIICSRAIRSWTFDVRLNTLTSRLEQLDSIINSRLYVAENKELGTVEKLGGCELEKAQAVGGKPDDNKAVCILLGNVEKKCGSGGGDEARNGDDDDNQNDNCARFESAEIVAAEVEERSSDLGMSTLSATRMAVPTSPAASVVGPADVGVAVRANLVCAPDVECGLQGTLHTRTLARAAARNQLASMHPQYEEVQPAKWMQMLFSGENTSVFGGNSIASTSAQ